jgi:hypothetical protein
MKDYLKTFEEDVSFETRYFVDGGHPLTVVKLIHNPTGLISQRQSYNIVEEELINICIKRLKESLELLCKYENTKNNQMNKIKTDEVEKGSIADIFGRTNETLSSDKRLKITRIKFIAAELHRYLSDICKEGLYGSVDYRDIAIAKEKLQECVMWAVKGVCSGE